MDSVSYTHLAEYGEVPETQNYLAALHELAGKCRQRQLLLEKQKKYLQQKQGSWPET